MKEIPACYCVISTLRLSYLAYYEKALGTS